MEAMRSEDQLSLRDGLGLWSEKVTDVKDWSAGKRALFLDRDGVIVEHIPYLHDPDKTKLIAGSTEIIRSCNKRKIPVVLVTNQSGIGRGMYDWQDFVKVQTRLIDLLGESGASVDMVLACAYHPDVDGEYKKVDHSWRKPGGGMISEAERVLQLDLSGSWIIGDKDTDMEAGMEAGLAGGVLVLSGETSQTAADSVAGSSDFRLRKAYSIAACRFLVDYMSQ